MAEPVPGIQAVPDEQNARYFHVVVEGPRDVGGSNDWLLAVSTMCGCLLVTV